MFFCFLMSFFEGECWFHQSVIHVCVVCSLCEFVYNIVVVNIVLIEFPFVFLMKIFTNIISSLFILTI